MSRKLQVSILSILIIPVSIAANAQDIVTTNQNSSTIIQTLGNTKTVLGGVQRGDNVFHEFSRFNIPQNSAVFFNSIGSKNIFSIIRDQSPSIINGVVGANTNLFLFSRNGFVIGPDSFFNIAGNLTISTPDKLEFTGSNIADLTVNTPQAFSGDLQALIFENNSGGIDVLSKGHEIIQLGTLFQPNVGGGLSTSGIRLNQGSKLFLGASKIKFNSGIATVPSGNISVVGIKTGRVDFQNSSTPLIEPAAIRGDVSLVDRSLIDASGNDSSILIYGGKVDILNESLVYISNPTQLATNNINIDSTALNILGQIAPPRINPVSGNTPRGIISQTAFAKGADINIKSEEITVDESGAVIAATFGNGIGGTININSNNFRVLGGSDFGLNIIGSQVLTTALGSGAGGDININSNLELGEGAFLEAAAFSSGMGGNINLVAETVVIKGGLQLPIDNSFVPSSLGTTTIASGQGGSLNVKSKTVKVTDGGRIDASALQTGNAGSISIDAINVQVTGSDPVFKTPSTISSASDQVDPLLNRIFLLPNAPTGEAGSVTINSQNLEVSNGGEISVQNVGSGDGGDLSLVANRVNLFDKGRIVASTQSGNGGDISIDSERLQIQNASIVASSEGAGKGGTITIDSSLLNVGNNGEISVQNTGSGDAGNLIVQSKRISLFDNARLIASTQGGDGGSIFIQSDLVQLFNSSITSSAQGQGTGGSIVINSKLVTTVGDSIFSANAQQSTGGRIIINSDGLLNSFQTQFSATSALGPQFNGTVDLNISQGQIIEKPQEVKISRPTITLYQACTSAFPHLTFSSDAETSNLPATRHILAAASLKHRLNIASQYFFIDSRTGERKPLRRWLGLQTKENGMAEVVYEPEQSEELHNLIYSLENKCDRIKHS